MINKEAKVISRTRRSCINWWLLSSKCIKKHNVIYTIEGGNQPRSAESYVWQCWQRESRMPQTQLPRDWSWQPRWMKSGPKKPQPWLMPSTVSRLRQTCSVWEVHRTEVPLSFHWGLWEVLDLFYCLQTVSILNVTINMIIWTHVKVTHTDIFCCCYLYIVQNAFDSKMWCTSGRVFLFNDSS